MPAIVVTVIVVKKLDGFKVSLKNYVVAWATDNAAIMPKFGKIIPCKHQHCYAHSILLAAYDELYKKNTIISSIASKEMKDEKNFPDASLDEELENEYISSTVEFEKNH